MKLPKISLCLVLLTTGSSLWGLLVTDYWLENTRVRKTENQSRTENMAKTHGSQ
jgi:hypothetical protein